LFEELKEFLEFSEFSLHFIKNTVFEMCSAPSLIRSLWGTVKCGLVPTLCGNRVSIAGKAKKQRPIRVTGIIEDGIMESVLFGAVRKIFEAAQVDVQWDYRTQILWRNQKTNRMTVCPELLSSVAETGLVLHVKDPALRQNESEWSSTLALNKALNTFVGVRRFNSAAGNEPYGPVNLINIRDNVSGEYSEIEHLVCPGKNNNHHLFVQLDKYVYLIVNRHVITHLQLYRVCIVFLSLSIIR